MKSLRNIRHVIVIYNQFEEERAEFISTFFRLAGIYTLLLVDNNIMADADLDYKGYVIVLNGNEDSKVSRRHWKYNWIDLKMPFLPGKINDSERLVGYLCKLLDDMQKADLEEQYSRDVFFALKKLADIYVKQNLMLYNYTLRLVAVTPEKKRETLLKTKKHFLEAVFSTEGLEKYHHCFYFKQECKRKVNLASRLAGQLKYYESNVLVNENIDYLGENEEFTCLWTLNGMIADEDNDKLYMAVDYYQMHLDEEQRLGFPKDEKFHGYIYYRMGRYYEKIRLNWKTALQYYTTAYQVAPSNYRFIYKVAFGYEVLRMDRMAEKYYDIIMEHMHPYIEKNYLTPRKCEYAFKVARRLIFLNKRQQQFFYAREMALLAIQIGEGIPNNLFIDNFYSRAEANEIKEGMQRRLAVEKTKEELKDIEKIIEMYY